MRTTPLPEAINCGIGAVSTEFLLLRSGALRPPLGVPLRRSATAGSFDMTARPVCVARRIKLGCAPFTPAGSSSS